MNQTCDISWFTERDIDLWLTEELRVNSAFAHWFAARAGLPENIIVPANRSQPSVVDETGETDVEAEFLTRDGSVVALLIENKITAGFQRDQLTRYLRRGEIGRGSGRWKHVAVVVFAPSHYASSVSGSVGFVSFEEAAEFLSEGRDERSKYRSDFIRKAVHRKIVALEDYDPFRVEWWSAVDEMVRSEFGNFFVIDRRSFPKTTYVNPRCRDMAAYLRVDLKGHLGEVDLTFKNVPYPVLQDAVNPIKPLGTKVIRNAKSAALRIDQLKPFMVSDGLGIINSRVRDAYAAAQQLLSFWEANSDAFDALVPHEVE